MPDERILNWKQQQVPALMGLAGALMVAFDFITVGFLLIIFAVLYSGYRSDATMKEKSDIF